MTVRALTGGQRERLICGWIDRSQIVDMLVRHTVFETIVLLSREKVDGHKRAIIGRQGKNWYAQIDGCIITVNASSYTIITAHKEK